jgi:CRP/FNR family transcriptional regulator, cyclic AMP receptor protein
MKLDALRSVPLFRELDNEAAQELCDLLTVQNVAEGTSLFHRGDPGDAMFLIETGRVRISVRDADGHDVTLADMGSGEFFGEMAMVDGQSRSADATAIKDSTLAVLAIDDFRSLVRKKPHILLGMLMALTYRLRRTDNLLRHRISRNVNELEASNLTFADRAADFIAEFGGSWKFIIAFAVFLNLWMLLNTWLFIGKTFDPYPFVFLNLVLGMITSLQAPIIMMSQNRQAQQDRLRADLDYRLNLKNELLLSEVLHRLEAIDASRSPSASVER